MKLLTTVRALPTMGVLAAMLSLVALPAGAQTQQFNDVPPEYWAFDFINTLADAGVTSGCGNDNYCPDDSVTRAQMAVFIERGLRGSAYVPPPATGNTFFDVQPGAFAADFIEQLALDGITGGCGNDNYCPDDAVTRAQMAVFLLRSIYGPAYAPPPPVGAFDDVATDYWAAAWIEQLAAEGITAGCGGGNYCPTSAVTRAQMAVFLVRTFALDVPPARLSSLTLTGSTLEQPFDPDRLSYTALSGFLDSVVTIDAAPENPGATIEVNGEALTAGGVPVALDEGSNDIDVVVTSGTTVTAYTVRVTRQTGQAFAADAYVKASNTGNQDRFGHSIAISRDTLVVAAPLERSAATGVNGDQGDNSANGAGAVYVFTRAGDTWSQQAYLKASNTDAVDQFGWSVALDGDTLVVGAANEASAATGVDGDQADNSASGAGAAYVFTRDGGVWSQQAYLKASNTEAGGAFGFSVAVSADTIAVAALLDDGLGNDFPDSGAVYVFTRTAGIWSEQAYLTASDAAEDDQFGYDIALDGDTLAVGAPLEDGILNDFPDAGAVYVFTRTAGSWSEQDIITASNFDAGDRFGSSVALAGDLLAAGAEGEDGGAAGVGGDAADNSAPDAGAVYLFERDVGGNWLEQVYVKALNPDIADSFGNSVALADDILAVGAWLEASAATGLDGDDGDNSANDAGAAYLYTRDGEGDWAFRRYIKASNTDTSDWFGWAVALGGDTLAIGAAQEDSAAVGVGGDDADNSAAGAGAVYLFGGLPERNARLASIELDEAELDQIFQPTQTTYTADVGFLVSSLRLTLPSQDPDAVVRLNGELVDAAGVELALAEGVNQYVIQVTAEDGVTTIVYTLTITRAGAAQFAQAAYVKASNTEAPDRLGLSVALSGDTLAVGAYTEDSSATGVGGNQADNSAEDAGAVYVFTRDGAGVWSQQAYLKASNTGAGDRFGVFVALDGDWLAVGATGEDSAATGIDGNGGNNSAPDSGAVYVFSRTGAVWSQQAYVKASNTDAGDGFGVSVALDAATLAVGAWREDSGSTGVNGIEASNALQDSGAVYVFARDGAGTWTQQAFVKASNTNAMDEFGWSVALSGDTLVAGAPFEDSAATGIDGDQGDNSAEAAGAAYVFRRFGESVWLQERYFKASNTGTNDRYGISVAAAEDTIAVGAFFESSAATGVYGDQGDNSARFSGAVYVYRRDGFGFWNQEAYVKASNTGEDDWFGVSVALDGSNLAVGARREESAAIGINGNGADDSAGDSGAAYLFVRDDAGIWAQRAYVKASNTGAGDEFGASVTLSGDTFAAGAYLEDSNATGVGGDAGNDIAIDSGAVYVFE